VSKKKAQKQIKPEKKRKQEGQKTEKIFKNNPQKLVTLIFSQY